MKDRTNIGCNLADIKKSESYNPKNREVAFTFQLHDSVQVLYAMAFCSPEHFEKQLQIIETYVQSYRNGKAKTAPPG